ncbi:hypothetical protein Kpol_139p1 [Vanderwaltozyma polyspora DSM 70294]|uniref:Phosphatidylserine decarboxylase proenzyme 1, mitochondrial n=1 Tax=Vanderwaltozyma polyspora (strain ATCC 22028 / DSM 70294 / BCRC 21397 / CBS 2163 / NBRC 10782 / NRRL Y-8283 / UCD 57-17) TaxID=436907 RepID=A7TTW1_VANPO|nr:uncharacterized protein Kpol_139p1 [Vanderwaltozyma polyspora DSM 70294]EDO14296.1 hypothetical protein Kpol_139p1 [Vanderwaltozyma polyspora DSM 70294]
MFLKLLIIIAIGIFSFNKLSAKPAKKADSGDEREPTAHSSKSISILNNSWLFFLYSTLPLNYVSRLWGEINHITVPILLRPIFYKTYAFFTGSNLNEMVDKDLTHYENLAEFFYREIDTTLRPVFPGEDVVTSPADGRVLQFGVIDAQTGQIQQVKGMSYSVTEFLGTHDTVTGHTEESLKCEDTKNHEARKSCAQFKHFFEEDDTFCGTDDKIDPRSGVTGSLLQELTGVDVPFYKQCTSVDLQPKKNELYYIVVYLSPGDYHRFHSPANWVCKLRRHFPGDLFSVSPYFQKNFPNLFVLNERVPMLGYWKYGFFSMTAVGATNVGSIKLNFDSQLKTNNCKHVSLPHALYEASFIGANSQLNGVPLLKGEEMGGFEFGSTVVLTFEAPPHFKFNVLRGQKVRVGEKLGGSIESEI